MAEKTGNLCPGRVIPVKIVCGINGQRTYAVRSQELQGGRALATQSVSLATEQRSPAPGGCCSFHRNIEADTIGLPRHRIGDSQLWSASGVVEMMKGKAFIAVAF